MTVTIILPSSTREKVNVKDAALGVLSETYPLSLKKIYNEIKKQYGISATYQGVRKAVNALEEAKVLTKNEREYAISKEWILNARAFVQNLHETYFEARKSKGTQVVSKSYKEFQIETLYELDNFWYSVIIDYINRAANVSKKSISITGNQWWMILNLGNETKLMNTVTEKGYRQYLICTRKYPLNKWAMQIYAKFGFPFKFVNDKTTIDINVYGNLVIEVHYPQEIFDDIEKLFNSAKEVKDIDPLKIHNLGHKKTQITIKIFEDQIIADNIREKVLSNF